MSDDKITGDPSEIKEKIEDLQSEKMNTDVTTIVKHDKKRRLTMKPSNRVLKGTSYVKSSDEGSSHDEPEEEDTFDTLILDNFNPFSGNENVIEWLDITDEKFNAFKISRKLRWLAIPLLVKGDAKRTYINYRDKINTYDDFYTLLLREYKSTNYNLQNTKSYSEPSIASQSNLIHDLSLRKNVAFDDQPKVSTDSFELNDSLPEPPILRSTALVDLGTTGTSGDDPSHRSNVASVQNTFLHTSILDQTAYALRRAVIDNLIKNPKTFRGGKDDVKQWLEEIE